MVSKEMKKYGSVAEALNKHEYGELEGLIKELLPIHVPIDIERKVGKVELWGRKGNEKLIKTAVKKARDMHKKYGTDAMSKALKERIGRGN